MPVSFFAIEMTSTKSTLFILTLLPRTYAYTEFKPDCPLPPSGTNYVAGPNVRSSLTILWNCLSVILLCTWNIQHLNIPVRRENAEDFVKKHEKKKNLVEDPTAKSILVDSGPSYSCEMDGYNSLRPGDSGGEGILRVEIIY